ncbi:hypothetical protein SDC9_179890 [bioreactor metagenome]|uniref:Uncharacterized protein n=1 Tax=bioreactor metagenome TaxID=1076179 RepID=A0A645H240_9ZZZZ
MGQGIQIHGQLFNRYIAAFQAAQLQNIIYQSVDMDGLGVNRAQILLP